MRRRLVEVESRELEVGGTFRVSSSRVYNWVLCPCSCKNFPDCVLFLLLHLSGSGSETVFDGF